MSNLFKERVFFKITTSFFILSLVFLLLFGFILVLSQKVHATEGVSVPRLDSDHDGILDFYETNVYGTDPNKADTDGDGFHDDQELMWGFDPLNSDPSVKYLLSTFSPFLMTSDATIARHLTVKGNLVADDKVKVAKDFEVFGPAIFRQGVTVEGRVNLQGSLYNSSKNPVQIQDSLNVTSKITTKNLKVKNTIRTKNLIVTGTWTVENLKVNNNAEIVNKLTAGELAVNEDKARVGNAQVVVSTNDSSKTQLIQSGISVCTASSGRESVTFSTPFESGTTPSVIVVPQGSGGLPAFSGIGGITSTVFGYALFQGGSNGNLSEVGAQVDCSVNNTTVYWIAVGNK